MGDFDYLKEFVSIRSTSDPNWFVPLDEDLIAATEKRLGFSLSPKVKAFYLEIGSGFLRRNQAGEVCNNVNRVLTPDEAADLYLGEDEELLPPEGFEEGDLPVFEAGSQLFLVMKPGSRDPDAVFWMYGEKVADDFSEFIERLYYESPTFYEDP